MNSQSQDVNVLFNVIHSKVNEIINDCVMQDESVQDPTPADTKTKKPLKRIDNPFIKKTANLARYAHIQRILLTGCNRLNETIINGIISMLLELQQKYSSQDTEISESELGVDNEITLIKFCRLVMFNSTFYLSSQDPSQRSVFLTYTATFIQFIK
jgi:hypothetical protein